MAVLAKTKATSYVADFERFEKAVELFDDDVASAVQWLTTPKKALGGEIPLRYARTEPGPREVENLIGRLEYGVFS